MFNNVTLATVHKMDSKGTKTESGDQLGNYYKQFRWKVKVERTTEGGRSREQEK